MIDFKTLTMNPSLVEQAFRDALCFHHPIDQVTPLFGGFRSKSWKIKTESATYLFKIVDDQFKFERFQEHDLAAKLARNANVVSPQVLFYDYDLTINGQHFMIQEYFPGRDASNALKTMDNAQMTDFFIELGHAIANLHAVKAPLFGDIQQTRTYIEWPAVIKDRLKRHRQKILDSNILSQSNLDRIINLVNVRLSQLPHGIEPRLCHRDLHLANIIVLDQGGIALIDFDHARFYDPLIDFAKLQIWVLTLYPRYKTQFMAAYKRIAPWPQDAEDRIRTYEILEYLAGLSFFAKFEPQVVPSVVNRLEKAIEIASIS